MNTMHNIDLEEIKKFIDEVSRTKEYDKKRISKYHERIFGKDNNPVSEYPCAIMQMRKIKAWYQDQKKDKFA